MTGPPLTAPVLGTPDPDAPFNPYTQQLEDDESGASQALRRSLFVATRRPPPERWAQVTQLADRLRLPTELVDRNFDTLQQAEARRRLPDSATPNQYDALLRDTPGLARWLADPDNATLARGELGPLARIERGTQLVAQSRSDSRGSFFGGALGTGTNDLEVAAGSVAVAYGLADPARAAQFVAAANARAAELRASAPAYVAAYERANEGTRRRAAILRVLATQSTPDMQSSATVLELLDFLGQAITHPRGFLYHTVESLPSAAPAIAGAVAGGKVGAAAGTAIEPGGGTLIGGAVGVAGGTFLGMAPVSVGAELNAELERRGIDVTDPAALERAYRDPEILKAARRYAERRGLTTAAINALIAPFAGKLAAGAAEAGAPLSRVAAATAADVGLQAAGQTAADVGGQLAGAKGDVAHVSIDDALLAGVQALGYGVGQEAVGLARRGVVRSVRARYAADPVRAAADVAGDAAEALRAQRDVQALREIDAAVREAPTTAQLPDRIRQLVEVAAGGEDAGAVYFQAGDWDAYWRATGELPARAAAELLGDGGRAYDEAQATGAPMRVPLGAYVAKVAGTPHFEGLLPVTRTAPDGMTLGEAHEYLQALPMTLQEIATDAARVAAPLELVRQSSRPLEQEIAAQLKAARVPGGAKTNAQLVGAFFRTMGERLGLDPAELYRRYQLRVTRGEAPPAPAPEPGADQFGIAESAAERAAIAGEDEIAGPYALPERERNYRARTEAGEFVYARTRGGALRSTLERVSTDGLVDELARLLERNAQDTPVESVIPDENFHTTSDARPVVRMGEGAKRAAGRIAARKQTIAKLEAELTRRGVDDLTGRLARHVLASDLADATDFSFEQGPLQRAAAAAKTPQFVATRAINDREHTAIYALPSGDEAFVQYSVDGAQLNIGFIGSTGGTRSIGAFVRAIGRDLRERTGTSSLVAERISGARPGRTLELPTVLLQETPQGLRGRIRLQADGGAAEIELLATADRSTFLHETGHFYLHILDTEGAKPDAPADVAADRRAIRAWLGVEDDLPLTVEQHEQFARGFEAYLMEGRAPSPTLRGAFSRFRAWLVNLYRTVRSLDVELTDDVRGVFDRLLATQEEIAQAEYAGRTAPLFDNPAAAGMSPEQWQRYRAAIDDAHAAAEEELGARLVTEQRRQETREWKERRQAVEQEMTERVHADQVYQARALLTMGTKPDGSPLDEGLTAFKLSRRAVRDAYGDELYERLPRGVTSTGDDALTPTMAAEMLGFANGRALLEALALAPTPRELIRSLTDEAMVERYGERMTPEQMREAAMAAVREQRVQVLRKELEHLASDHLAQFKGLVRAVTKRVPPSEAVRAQAERLIGEKTVRDLRPFQFEVAARRAATDAREALLRGDIDAAFTAKERELLATEMHRAATAARARVQGALKDFRRIFRTDAQLAGARDIDLVNAARAILASVGIGRTDAAPETYLAQMRRYDPEQAEVVSGIIADATAAAPGAGADYRNLRFDDFVALHDAVESLWGLARRTRQVEIDGQLVEREMIEGELAARLVTLSDPAPRAGYQKAATAWERTKMSLLGVRAALRRAEHWADAMDGGNPDGAFRRYIWNPVSEGATQYRIAMRSALERYLTVVEGVREQLTTDAIPAPELGYEFRGTVELLGAMLHTGNLSNLTKLLVGRGWGALTETGALDRTQWDAFVDRMHREGILRKEHYDYLQGVWDLFEDVKAPAQRAHKAMYGHYFAELTREPVRTPYGEYAGGYAPAMRDPFVVTDAAIQAERDAVLHGDNSFMFPTTGRGFTRSRVERYAAPLLLDVRLVPSHLDAVLRFTHIEPRVKDVGRIVTSRSLASTLDAFDPTVRGDLLVPWLQRAAQQRVETPSSGWAGKAIDRVARGLRRRSGMQILAVNVVNAVQQLTGLSISAVKVSPRYLGPALWRYVRAPRETFAAVGEQSDYMRSRTNDHLFEVQRTIHEITVNPSRYDKLRDFTTQHGHFLTAVSQHVVDVVTWIGAYEEAAARGAPEREAVRAADSAVRETQGSPFAEDISRAETGTAFYRLFNMFTGYFNMQANLLGSEFLNTVRELGMRKGAGRLLYVYLLGFAVPAALSEGIMMAARGKPIDEDDDGPWDDLLAHFFGSQLSGVARMVPVVGPVAEATVRGFTGHGDDRITASAAITTLERSVKAPADVYHSIRDHEPLSASELRDVFTAIGILTGLPTAPLAKPVGYLRDVSSGRASPANLPDRLRGLTTGYPGGAP